MPSFLMRRGCQCVLGLTAIAITGCGSSKAARPATDQAQDVQAVESVLHAWYDASERHDSAAYAAPLLPEFFIFEDTTRYDKPALVKLVAESFSQGTDRATLSDLQTVVVGDAAWTSFKNSEVFTPLGAPPLPARRYLETAVFRRVDGQWRLERYHATHINREPPAP